MSKSSQAFRTIREVSDWLDVKAHVLRFWESKFPQIKPVKRAGGRRYYRPADMELVGGIKVLLHEQGMTIKGVQTLIRDQGVGHVMQMSPAIDAFDDGAVVDEDVAAWDAALTDQDPGQEIGPDTATTTATDTAQNAPQDADPVVARDSAAIDATPPEPEPAQPEHADAEAGLFEAPPERIAGPTQAPEPETPPDSTDRRDPPDTTAPVEESANPATDTPEFAFDAPEPAAPGPSEAPDSVEDDPRASEAFATAEAAMTDAAEPAMPEGLSAEDEAAPEPEAPTPGDAAQALSVPSDSDETAQSEITAPLDAPAEASPVDTSHAAPQPDPAAAPPAPPATSPQDDPLGTPNDASMPALMRDFAELTARIPTLSPEHRARLGPLLARTAELADRMSA